MKAKLFNNGKNSLFVKEFPHFPHNVKIALSLSFPNLFCLSFVHFVTFAGRRQNKLQPK